MSRGLDRIQLAAPDCREVAHSPPRRRSRRSTPSRTLDGRWGASREELSLGCRRCSRDAELEWAPPSGFHSGAVVATVVRSAMVRHRARCARRRRPLIRVCCRDASPLSTPVSARDQAAVKEVCDRGARPAVVCSDTVR